MFFFPLDMTDNIISSLKIIEKLWKFLNSLVTENNFPKQNFYKQISEFDNKWFIFKNWKRPSYRESFH